MLDGRQGASDVILLPLLLVLPLMLSLLLLLLLLLLPPTRSPAVAAAAAAPRGSTSMFMLSFEMAGGAVGWGLPAGEPTEGREGGRVAARINRNENENAAQRHDDNTRQPSSTSVLNQRWHGYALGQQISASVTRSYSPYVSGTHPLNGWLRVSIRAYLYIAHERARQCDGQPARAADAFGAKSRNMKMHDHDDDEG